MERFLVLVCYFFVLAVTANAQTFNSTATITISRKSDGPGAAQSKADQALMRDIERYVVSVAGAVVNPTEKDAAGLCLPFTYTVGKRTLNLEIYNRAAGTCAVQVSNGRTDLRGINVLSNVLNRLVNAQFGLLTDAQFVQDAVAAASKTAETAAYADAERAASKVDPP